MTEGRGLGPSRRPAVCSNSRFCWAPTDPGARRPGAQSGTEWLGVEERCCELSRRTVAVAAARGHSPFPSPPSRRVPDTARPQSPHTRSATSASFRAGAPEVTHSSPPAARTPLCSPEAVTYCSPVWMLGLSSEANLEVARDMRTVSLEAPQILPRRGIRCPRAGRGAQCQGSACSRIRVARVPHAKTALTGSFCVGGETSVRPSAFC